VIFNYSQKLITGILALVLVAGMTSPAFAGSNECQVDADCDDTLFCNGSETCNAGTCQAGSPLICNDKDECTIDYCNEKLDSCDTEPDPVCKVPVSGKLLSLDSSALVIGGLASSAVWMVPAVAGIAGAGIYLVKFRAGRD